MPSPPRRTGPTRIASTATFAGLGSDGSADEALSGFERFPAWMWRNVVVRDFVDWLHAHNGRQRERHGERQTGFYGLDLYSLHRSMQEVIAYLENVDPVAAARARERYACFDHTSADDGQAYGFAAAFGAGLSCERQAIDQLVEMQRNAVEYARRDGLFAEDEAVLRAAERADRPQRGGLLPGDVRWASYVVESPRSAHGADLASLAGSPGPPRDKEPARIVVWAHNSHVGDARATEVGADGQLTLGQLARERYGEDSRLIGFTT